MFEHRELRSWVKLGFLLSGFAGSLVGIWAFGFWSAFLFVPTAAVFATAAAMLGHEGSHKSFSKSPFRNAVIAYGAFPLFAGLGTSYWHNKHDRLHHGHPNVEGVDPDIKPFPFVSSRGDHEKCGRGERWFQRTFQSWAFWPMSLLMSLGMRRSSIIHMAKQKKRTRAWWIEATCMMAHYVLWIVVPSIVFGPLIGFAIYTAVWGLVGVCLALIFAPAHIGLPIMAEQNHDWIHQLETTRNLELPKVISFFFIGLDYQVEHHIFPKIPHAHLPRAAAITRAYCEKHGLKHLSVPYLYALGDAARFIAHAYDREAVSAVEVRAGLVAS